jgi:hypothetical protein
MKKNILNNKPIKIIVVTVVGIRNIKDILLHYIK